MQFDVAQHRRLDSRKGKRSGVEIGDRSGFGGLGPRNFAGQIHFALICENANGTALVAEAGQCVDPWPSWIAEAEQLGHLVVCLAAASSSVRPTSL